MARKIEVKLILMLRSTGISQRAICKSRHMPRSSVSEVFRIAEERQIAYADVESLPNSEVYSMFFPDKFQEETTYAPVDYAHVHSELKRPGITLIRLLSQVGHRFPDADAVNIYYSDRELDRDKMLRLATCQFMEIHRDVIFQGFTGSGKSWLACCIAKEACKRKYRTRYIRMPDLLTLYEEASVSKTGVSK